MRDTIRLGRIAGVRVGLNWSLVAMVVLVAFGLARDRFALEVPGYTSEAYAIAGVLTAIGLLLGVLLHEFGHAVLARRVGLRVDGITLSWMGGVTRIQGETVRPREELLVAGVGPAVSAALGGVLWLVRLLLEGTGGGALAIGAIGWLAVINLVLAGFNLLPAAPLDGGRVLHSAVWAITRDRWRAARASATTGVALGACLVAFGFIFTTRTGDLIDGLFIGFIGWWLLGSARAELNLASVHHALDDVLLGDLMRPVGEAPGWITVRAFAETYAGSHPGWVWLLRGWQEPGYAGVLLGDSLAAVPFPQWDILRPIDLATPISATTGAAPGDEALATIAGLGDKQVVLVIDSGRTLGAVLASDLEAIVKMGGKGPVPSRGWTLTRG